MAKNKVDLDLFHKVLRWIGRQNLKDVVKFWNKYCISRLNSENITPDVSTIIKNEYVYTFDSIGYEKFVSHNSLEDLVKCISNTKDLPTTQDPAFFRKCKGQLKIINQLPEAWMNRLAEYISTNSEILDSIGLSSDKIDSTWLVEMLKKVSEQKLVAIWNHYSEIDNEGTYIYPNNSKGHSECINKYGLAKWINIVCEIEDPDEFERNRYFSINDKLPDDPLSQKRPPQLGSSFNNLIRIAGPIDEYSIEIMADKLVHYYTQDEILELLKE